MEMVESSVPPGFRFHPTEEELVGYYLSRKVNSLKIDLGVIVDLDLYRMEPWDIQERCGLGYEEQNEWYFFSHKDKKYPTGTRTNRATSAGFWKATGRDKAVVSKNKLIIGMRKTLVFYKGRAPNGRKTDWIMHEYRLQTTEHAPPQEEGWVVCRAFKKPSPNHKQGFETWNHHPHCVSWDNGKFEEPSSRLDLAAGPTNMAYLNQGQGIAFPQSPFSSQLQDLIMSTNCNTHLQNQLVQLPLQLDYSDHDPPFSTSLAANNGGADQLNAQNNNYLLNLPLVSQEFGFSAQNHASTLFTSLPDL